MGLLIIFLIILYVALATLLIRVVRKKTSNKLYRRLAVAFVILLPSWDVLLGFISSRKTPGFAGGLTEFDSSGNTSYDVCIRRSINGLSSWRRLLYDAHLSAGLDVLNSFDCGQAPLRGQQS